MKKMAICKLFDNWTWGLPLPKAFQGFGKSISSTSVFSKYNMANHKKATVHPITLKAILIYMETEENKRSFGAVGHQNDSKYMAEYVSSEGTYHGAVFQKTNGTFCAGVFDDIESSPEVYYLKEGKELGTALFLALMPLFLEDEEFKEHYGKLYECKKNGFLEEDNSKKEALYLCDNVYRRIGNAAQLGDAGIEVSIPISGKIPILTELNLRRGYYAPTYVYCGRFQILMERQIKQNYIPMSNQIFSGKYKTGGTHYTEKEREQIPILQDSYVIPQYVVSCCSFLKETEHSEHPIRNIMLRGGSGTGKTEGAKAIACGLERPYVYMTCHANMEISDLLGQYLPVAEKETEDLALPSLFDIQMDPATAYYTLTGEYKESIEEEAVYQKLIEIVKQCGATSAKEKKQKFCFVESPLVQALRYGYVIEIQEAAVIMNPGVLVGLNGLLDRCEAVLLPNGEVLKRHPNTVIVMTTNNTYEGCHNINQSILSRMDIIIDLEELDKEAYQQRAAKITKCTDTAILQRMAEAMVMINQRCKTHMITDGSCGMRELIAWVQLYMILKDPLEAAEYTVLSSVSADPENRKDILDSCISPLF